MQRKIIHIDADCFYAALEMRDHPHLREKPLAVGGSAARRGVISTCNYEARRFGVRSAMATQTALRICPSLVLMPHRFEVYRAASRQMQQIFSDYTDLIEPLSLDEAYLDVSGCRQFDGSATRIAEDIRQRVRAQVGITVSAGVAPNKFLAKVASDWHKPDGLCVIRPEQVQDFIQAVPVARIFGVGRVTAARMNKLGLQTCGDLQQWTLIRLVEAFGNFGPRLYELCRGQDTRAVKPERTRKSLSVEHTYEKDLADAQACLERLPALLDELESRLAKLEHRSLAKCFVKVKFSDFTTTTLERTGTRPGLATYQRLMSEALARSNLPVRLLGVGVRFEEPLSGPDSQLSLFPSA